MKLHPSVLTQLDMLRRGQLIISGGGVTVRQIPSGQYEILVTAGDIKQTDDRNDNRNTDFDDSGPGIRERSLTPGSLTPIPSPPSSPAEDSGTYGGDTMKGRRIKGATGDPADSEPYSFTQRGWEYYIINF
jgi:hypothetical protein